jgi:disulfide oxidoreductase YuzD
MSDTIDPQAFIDHAGDFYDWFSSVYVQDGELVIVADENPNDDSAAPIARVTPEKLYEYVSAAIDSGYGNDYDQVFYIDFKIGNDDDADGDMDSVDIILQLAVFGEIVYG